MRQQNPALNYQIATPGYFETMRISLVRGRVFDARDVERSPRVAVVGESAARRLWPGEDPVGKRLAMPSFAPDGSPSIWRTVVGVVSDVKYRGINDARLDVYDAALQAHQTAAHLVVRTAGDPLNLAAAVQSQARQLYPLVVIDGVKTLEAIVSRAMAPWRLSAWMLTLFAALAFALASVGLFSLVSLDLASRRHELAVRVALGATRRDILRAVMTSAGGWVAAGVTAGLIVSVAGGRVLRSLLFEVGVLDGVTYAAVIGLVVGVVVLAIYLPASRAAAIDPISLLKRSQRS
jgi:putative ABC transport system permease protein